MMTIDHQFCTQITHLALVCVMSRRARDSQSDQDIVSAGTDYGISHRYPDLSFWRRKGNRMRMNHQIF